MLLPPNDSASWVAALDDLRANPAKREQLARQARQDVNRYTWESRALNILRDIQG